MRKRWIRKRNNGSRRKMQGLQWKPPPNFHNRDVYEVNGKEHGGRLPTRSPDPPPNPRHKFIPTSIQQPDSSDETATPTTPTTPSPPDLIILGEDFRERQHAPARRPKVFCHECTIYLFRPTMTNNVNDPLSSQRTSNIIQIISMPALCGCHALSDTRSADSIQ